MTRRMIISEMWEDDFFVNLSFLHRLIWIGIITACADDQGRFQDNPNLIKARIFPMDNFEPNDIEKALVEFYKAHKVVRYIADCKHVIQIVSWWKHQTPQWAGKSIFKPPKGWIDRERYHGKENKIHTLNWELPGGYPDGYIADYIEGFTINDVNGEGEGEGDVNGEGNGKELPPLPNNYTLYEKEIGHIVPSIADFIDLYEKELSVEWVRDAILETSKHGVSNMAYVKKVLDTWKIHGRKTDNPQRQKSNGDVTQELINKKLAELGEENGNGS